MERWLPDEYLARGGGSKTSPSWNSRGDNDTDLVAIEKEVYGLPLEDMHCSRLADGTIQDSVRLYRVGDGRPFFFRPLIGTELHDNEQSG